MFDFKVRSAFEGMKEGWYAALALHMQKGCF